MGALQQLLAGPIRRGRGNLSEESRQLHDEMLRALNLLRSAILEIDGATEEGPGSGGGPSTSSATISDVSAVDVNNTTSETTLASLTLPADSLSENGSRARMSVRGDILNLGASRSAVFRVRFGGTIYYEDLVAIGNVNDRRPLRIDLEVIRISASSQLLTGVITLGAANGAEPDVGTGGSMVSNGLQYSFFNVDPSIDETADQDIEVSIEHSVASENMRTRVQAAHLWID
jgi:hypothetical protein